jgi:hypothetical protein
VRQATAVGGHLGQREPGENPVYVKAQLGHTDATLTLNYYAHEMNRRDGEPERLKALVQGEFGQRMDEKPVLAEAKAASEPVAA